MDLALILAILEKAKKEALKDNRVPLYLELPLPLEEPEKFNKDEDEDRGEIILEL